MTHGFGDITHRSGDVRFIVETIYFMSEAMLIVLVTLPKPLEATPKGLMAFHGDAMPILASRPLCGGQGRGMATAWEGIFLSFAGVAGILTGIKFVKVCPIRVQARHL
jgi:hypothetical protein